MGKTRAEQNKYMAQYVAKRYKERRAAVLEQMGNHCYWCPSTEALEIDHVNRAWKRLDLNRRFHSAPWWLLQQELMACQLLCHSCHIAKSGNERGNGHGGGLTGVRNCYCDLCKPLKQQYNRNRKLRIALEEVLAEIE